MFGHHPTRRNDCARLAPALSVSCIGFANQRMAEAEGVLSRERRAMRADQLLADELLEVFVHPALQDIVAGNIDTVRGHGPDDFTELVLDSVAHLLALSDLGVDEQG